MFSNTAPFYDLLYEASGKDYAAEASVVHDLIQARKPGARSLLDVGCGTGGHLRHLREWYAVTGLDSDPAMLAEARKHLPDVLLIEADMRTFQVDATFEALICLFSSVGYLRDTGELHAALRTMADHLAPGGVLVLDGWVRPEAWVDGGSAHVEVAKRDAVQVVRMSRSERHGTTTRLEMHHLLATEAGIEHLVDHHELTLFSRADYEEALRGAGFAFEVTQSPMEGRDRYVGVKES